METIASSAESEAIEEVPKATVASNNSNSNTSVVNLDTAHLLTDDDDDDRLAKPRKLPLQLTRGFSSDKEEPTDQTVVTDSEIETDFSPIVRLSNCTTSSAGSSNAPQHHPTVRLKELTILIRMLLNVLN